MKMFHVVVYMGPKKSPLTRSYCPLLMCPRAEHSPFAGEKQPETYLKKEGKIGILKKMTQIRVG